jgi:drug/metabolite transporter (DMT)-like permease
MNKRTLGLLAALGATLIYGFNHTIAKNVMPTYIQPFGFIFLRVSRSCYFILDVESFF